MSSMSLVSCSMALVSYAITVVFNNEINLPIFTFIVHHINHIPNSTSLTFQPLLRVAKMIRQNVCQIVASIIAKKPFALNEHLFNDLFSITAACRHTLYEFFVPKNSLLYGNTSTTYLYVYCEVW